MTVGENIKRIRKEKHINQEELAILCGISATAIRGFEKGRYQPKTETVKKIAYALGVEPYEIDKKFLYLEQCASNVSKTMIKEVDFWDKTSELYGVEISELFRNIVDDLNIDGQRKAKEYVNDLMLIDKYKKI